MSVNDLRELSVQELENKIVDLKKELMDSRFALATSQIEAVSYTHLTLPTMMSV